MPKRYTRKEWSEHKGRVYTGDRDMRDLTPGGPRDMRLPVPKQTLGNQSLGSGGGFDLGEILGPLLKNGISASGGTSVGGGTGSSMGSGLGSSMGSGMNSGVGAGAASGAASGMSLWLDRLGTEGLTTGGAPTKTNETPLDRYLKRRQQVDRRY